MENKFKKIEKVAMVSENIENENLLKLRAVFPQFVKDGSIDFDALQAFLKKDGVLADEEKYGLNWAGKSKAFGDIRRTATGTFVPQEEESVGWDKTENIFIEGENLEVLKLLQKKYANPGKIKMIYIDPPYNTGKDFIYKDNFTQNVSDYYEQTGQTKDGIKLTSNSELNGRYHSDWLTMMYPRLFLARNLLKDDGVIFVSIDDNEVSNLRMIMDEIFGEENFVGQVVRESIKGGSQSDDIRVVHDYVLVYAKNIDEANFSGHEKEGIKLDLEDEKGKYAKGRELNKWGAGSRREDSPSMYFPIKGPKGADIYPIRNDGSDGRWRLGKVKMTQKVASGDVIFEKRENGTYIVYEKIRDNSTKIKQFTTIFKDNYINARGTEALKGLFQTERANFDYSKPVELVKDLVILADAYENDIVLDFFAGSGTTAHAVMDLNAEDGGNRKWICVQLPEATGEDSEAYKAGYKNIAEISCERIRRAAKMIEEEVSEKRGEYNGLREEMGYKEREIQELQADADGHRYDFDNGFKAFSLTSSNYRRWNTLTAEDDEKALLKQAKLFIEKPLVDKYNENSVIYEILLKEGFDLNSKVVEMKKGGIVCFKIIDGEKEMNITFANKLTKDQIDALELAKDTIFVCFDSALDDTTKVNIIRNLTVKTI